jgi:hypothetical protein
VIHFPKHRSGRRILRATQVLLVALSLIVAQSAFAEGKPLDWSEDRKLSWDDFKKKPPDPPPTTDGVKIKAEGKSGLVLPDWECPKLPTIKAVFEPDSSWVDPQSKSVDLLDHEQGHFDLAERAARKLNKEIAKLKLHSEHTTEVCKKLSEELNALYDKANSDLEKEQKKYEDETKHGSDPKEQAKWDKQIKEALAR